MKKYVQIAILLFAGLCAATSAQAQTASQTAAAPVQPANPALQGIVAGVNSGAANPASAVLTGVTAGALAGQQDLVVSANPALGLLEKTGVAAAQPVEAK